MNRFKIILGYVLGITSTITCVLLISLFIFKNSVFNKDYLKNILKEESYYENISNEIKENMENYMMSSGLPETILDDLYSKEDIQNQINLYIDNVYNGKITTINRDEISNKLNNNINNYIKDHNLDVVEKSYIVSFVQEMTNIYENELNFYGFLDGFISDFFKVSVLADKALIGLSIFLIILFTIMVIIKEQNISSVFIASGLTLLFIKLFFYEKIDINNILIISNNFSNIIKMIFINIGDYIIKYSLGLIIIGLILTIVKSFKKNK